MNDQPWEEDVALAGVKLLTERMEAFMRAAGLASPDATGPRPRIVWAAFDQMISGFERGVFGLVVASAAACDEHQYHLTGCEHCVALEAAQDVVRESEQKEHMRQFFAEHGVAVHFIENEDDVRDAVRDMMGSAEEEGGEA